MLNARSLFLLKENGDAFPIVRLDYYYVSPMHLHVAPMQQPKLLVLDNRSNETLPNRSGVFSFEAGEVFIVRCTVEGAPEMLIRWSLNYDVHEPACFANGTLSTQIGAHVVFILFLFLLFCDIGCIASASS